MVLDADLLQRLLYEEESDTLDFKRKQYPFVGANDNDKSELLKDVLAFANSWGRTDRYILIGVEEVKGGRKKVLGIGEQLDDASLQQFVNSKTKTPVDFSYQARQCEGKDIAVIHIPIQKRPVFLKKDFGKLKEEAVYVRRGSSTDEAAPDEVAAMGRDDVIGKSPEPELELQFANTEKRELLGNYVRVQTVAYTIPSREDICDSLNPYPSGLLAKCMKMRAFAHDYDYYSDLARYHQLYSSSARLDFAITNTGPVLAADVKSQIEVVCDEKDYVFRDESQMPQQPEQHSIQVPGLETAQFMNRDVTVTRYPASSLIEVSFGKVQPKSTAFSVFSLYVGSWDSRTIDLQASIYADNLAEPLCAALKIRIEVKKDELSMDRLLGLAE